MRQTLIWIWHFLAAYPEAQAKIREQLEAAVGKSNMDRIFYLSPPNLLLLNKICLNQVMHQTKHANSYNYRIIIAVCM